MKSKPATLWKCGKCRRPFANRNQSHSCGPYTVAMFLKGQTPEAIALFHAFVSEVRNCGEVILAPAKTRVGFQVRMIFAAVNKVTDHGLDAHVVLARRLESQRITRIDSISARNHVHHFRIRSLGEMDGEVRSWLKEAYRVGKQEHLTKAPFKH